MHTIHHSNISHDSTLKRKCNPIKTIGMYSVEKNILHWLHLNFSIYLIKMKQKLKIQPFSGTSHLLSAQEPMHTVATESDTMAWCHTCWSWLAFKPQHWPVCHTFHSLCFLLDPSLASSRCPSPLSTKAIPSWLPPAAATWLVLLLFQTDPPARSWQE